MIEAQRVDNEAVTAQETLEQELVAAFSDLADLFGNPPSLGAIYGLLFASEKPLSMEEIIHKLGISKGSASQGLRQLEELNAIIKGRESGERSHTFTARLELKPLLGGFLSKRLAPRLAANTKRVKNLQQLIPQLSPGARPAAKLRLQRLTKWHKRASTLLPLAQRLLQGD